MSKVIKLGNYKGIEFKVEKVPVSNEEVEQQIQMILAQSSQTEEKDGDTVENGDIATIDFVGLKDDVAFEGGTGNDYDLEIGSGSFIPGFEEQMIGMKVNETRDLNLTFPENYQAEDLAGQDVVFKVTVKKLSVKKEAELNDDFVEGLGVPEIKTVEDLKAYINEGLQQQHDQQYEAQKENTIFDAFTLKGAAALIQNNDTHPSVEIDKVTTPGGITIKGINELEHNGFTSAIIKAMKASK